MCICTIDHKRLSRKLENENYEYMFFLRVDSAANRANAYTGVWHELVPGLIKDMVPKVKLERKQLEQEVIIKAMTASVKILEKLISSMEH